MSNRLTVVLDPSSAEGWMILFWAEKEYPDKFLASPMTCHIKKRKHAITA